MTPPSDCIDALEVITAYFFGFVGGFFAAILLGAILSWVGVL